MPRKYSTPPYAEFAAGELVRIEYTANTHGCMSEVATFLKAPIEQGDMFIFIDANSRVFYLNGNSPLLHRIVEIKDKGNA